MPSTRLIVRGAPLPVSFQGDLNKLWSAMLDRLEVISPFGEVQIQLGGLQPTSNKGPWLKDGMQWYVWDEATKTYIPLDISASMAPVAAAIAAAILAAHTQVTTETTAAIAAAVAALPPLPTSLGAHFAVAQTSEILTSPMTNSGATVDIPFNTVEIDSESGFAAGVYTVKKAGFYSITFVLHTEQASGSITSLSIVPGLFVNGAGVRSASFGRDMLGSTIFEINHQMMLAVGDRISASVDFFANPATAGVMRIGTNNTRLSGFLTP